MALRTGRIRMRMRIDLALTDVELSTSAAPGRRQLLVPAAPAIGIDRLRPTLLAPVAGQPARFGSPEPLDY
jgi:hypothetical protein